MFGPLTMMVRVWMLTYAMTTLRVLRMPMHLSLGNMGLLREDFQAPKFFSIGLMMLGRLMLGFVPNF